jgi:hypothetical protein
MAGVRALLPLFIIVIVCAIAIASAWHVHLVCDLNPLHANLPFGMLRKSRVVYDMMTGTTPPPRPVDSVEEARLLSMYIRRMSKWTSWQGSPYRDGPIDHGRRWLDGVIVNKET